MCQEYSWSRSTENSDNPVICSYHMITIVNVPTVSALSGKSRRLLTRNRDDIRSHWVQVERSSATDDYLGGVHSLLFIVIEARSARVGIASLHYAPTRPMAINHERIGKCKQINSFGYGRYPSKRNYSQRRNSYPRTISSSTAMGLMSRSSNMKYPLTDYEMDKEMEEVIQRLSSLPPTAGVKRIKEAEKLGTSLADVCFALKDENLPELPYLDRLVEGRSCQKNFDSLSFILTKKVSCCGNILWFEKCNTSEYAAGGHRPTRSDAAKHYAIRKSQSKVLLFGILQCFRQLQVIFHTVWRRRVKILILSPPIGDHWRASNSRRPQTFYLLCLTWRLHTAKKRNPHTGKDFWARSRSDCWRV
ncbi:unnamed protein product [Nesidiocoris tenuis]|uniref:Uncharacterized protein n=1 Tax=Nesidiocoris tenuis TaxID=355587 RepID=A0A6H5GEU1_9HEMI|nr:unnamed protein product [Nesidiocoris tenuis]